MFPSQALQQHAGFSGSADEFGALIDHIAYQHPHIGVAAGEANERLIRHYVSVGVLDRPERAGKSVVYGFRHLLQYLVARRLLGTGFALAKIAEYTGRVPTQSLLASLDEAPQRSEAQLLVEAYGTPRRAKVERHVLKSAPDPQTVMSFSMSVEPSSPTKASSAGPDPVHSMVDLAHLFEARIDELGRDLHELRQFIRSLEKVVVSMPQSTMGVGRGCQEHYQEIRVRLQELAEFMAERIGRVAMEQAHALKAVESLRRELSEHFQALEKRQVSVDEALNALRGDLWAVQRGLGQGAGQGKGEDSRGEQA